MLTLHKPRATARLRLNVKVFNMGDYSPWQTIDQGRRYRPAVSLVLVWSIVGHPLPAGLPVDPGPCGPSLQTTPPVRSVLPSPRLGLTLASQPLYRLSRPTALNALRVLHQRV